MKKVIYLFIMLAVLGNSTAFSQSSNDSLQFQPISPERQKIGELKRLLDTLKDNKDIIDVYLQMSYWYGVIYNDSAMKFAEIANTLAKKIGDMGRQAMSEQYLGDRFGQKGNSPKQLEHYLKALELNEKRNDTGWIIFNLGTIRSFYDTEDDYERSLNYGRRAYLLSKATGDEQDIAIASFNFALSFQNLGNADSALYYYQESYQIGSHATSNINGNMAYTLNGLARVQLMMGNNDISLSYFRKCMPYAIALNNPAWIGSFYAFGRNLFEKIDLPDSSIWYAEKALASGLEVGEPKFLQECYASLARLYKGRDNNKSVEYFTKATDLRDSLFSAEKKREIANLNYNQDEKEKELAATAIRAKEERRQNLQYSALALGLVLFLIIFLLLGNSVFVKQGFIKFLGILLLLMIFEFISLFIHPYLAGITDHSPVLMLAAMVSIAALLIPLHHRLEKWITKAMVEKNKRIRLAAARKTIAKLEGEVPDKPQA